MVYLKHTGLYVSDLKLESAFYCSVFHMHIVCNEQEQKDALIVELLNNEDGTVRITKLITDAGKNNGYGDMLELIQVIRPISESRVPNDCIFKTGQMHLSFSVQNMEEVIRQIELHEGQRVTDIHLFNTATKCCFCKDPEGNWIELIENIG